MDIFSIIVIILGLCLFEVISSIDNAIINAEVLKTMGQKARKWFLSWGLIFAVFAIRGLLPWAIVWATAPNLGPIGAFTATFSSDPLVKGAIESSAPILLMGGGMFLIFLFFHWIFLEQKNYGLAGEKFIEKQGIWFFAIISIILCVVVWFSMRISTMIAFGAVIGSTVFFITHGFKQNAEENEKKLMKNNNLSDISKLMYLEIIDATFSIDGVLGAFAFTLAVPLILIGNGLGAFVVREFTIKNIENIAKLKYLKNGAMYSIFFLGLIMIADAFGIKIESWVSPLITFAVVGFFFWKSLKELKETEKVKKAKKNL